MKHLVIWPLLELNKTKEREMPNTLLTSFSEDCNSWIDLDFSTSTEPSPSSAIASQMYLVKKFRIT
jgi:hypothetical protein